MAVTPQRLHEFLSQDFGPDDWVVEGLLAAGSNTIIVAEEKAGKTYFAMALSLAVAAGVQFLAWPVQAPQRVLYVMTEGRPRMQWHRWHRLLRGMGLTSDALGIELLPTPYLYLDSNEGKDLLFNLVRVLKPRLLVLDPLFSFAEGDISGERTAKAVTNVLKETHFIAQQEGHDHATVVLHHTHRIRRDTYTGLPIDEQKEAYFGSKVLAAWVDSMIRLERYEGGEGAVILDLDREEDEDVKRLYDVRLVRESKETWRWELLPNQWGPLAEKILQRLPEFQGWTASQIGTAVGLPRQRVGEVLHELDRRRLIELAGGGRGGKQLRIKKVSNDR